MQEFIQQAAKQLGVSENGIQTATGGILSLMKDKSDAADFSAMASKIPGLADLAEGGKMEAASAGGGGLLGMATGALSKMGGSLGGAASLISLFDKSGLSKDQAGGFVSMLVGYLQQNAGNDLVGNILSKVPELKKLVS